MLQGGVDGQQGGEMPREAAHYDMQPCCPNTSLVEPLLEHFMHTRLSILGLSPPSQMVVGSLELEFVVPNEKSPLTSGLYPNFQTE